MIRLLTLREKNIKLGDNEKEIDVLKLTVPVVWVLRDLGKHFLKAK